MPLTTMEEFHLEEFKSLREEILTKLKDRLEFNRWGLIGLAALYSYIFTHPKFVLFLVPPIFCLIVIWHLLEEHKNVVRIAKYIKDDIERWLGATFGWENYLGVPGGKSLWKWSPLPLWYGMFVLTVIIAYLGWRSPSLFS